MYGHVANSGVDCSLYNAVFEGSILDSLNIFLCCVNVGSLTRQGIFLCLGNIPYPSSNGSPRCLDDAAKIEDEQQCCRVVSTAQYSVF